MHKPQGKSVLLAQIEGLGDVRLCSCGVVSLNLGGISLRLESAALPQLDRLLCDAIETMCRLDSANLLTATPASRQIH